VSATTDAVDDLRNEDDRVEANARTTAWLGLFLLIALAVEGVTVPDVSGLLSLHVFLGFFVIPLVVAKLGTTGYRFFHYYRHTAAYRRKGPPHPILRIAAPVVVAATIALLGTGVIMIIVGPEKGDTWRNLHQGSFVVWFVVMTVHVLGHALETWTLTRDDARARPPVPRRGVRLSVAAISLAVGLGLGIASTHWTSAWRNQRHDFGGDGAPALVSPATTGAA
jgi:hypothetical protein